MRTLHYNFDEAKFIKRISLVLLTIYLVVTLLIVRGQFTSSAQATTTYKDYVVSEGETVWSIASEYQTDNDVRSTVHDIITENNITSYIYVGQVIKVPVKK